jgi:hypothetical protein
MPPAAFVKTGNAQAAGQRKVRTMAAVIRMWTFPNV